MDVEDSSPRKDGLDNDHDLWIERRRGKRDYYRKHISSFEEGKGVKENTLLRDGVCIWSYVKIL